MLYIEAFAWPEGRIGHYFYPDFSDHLMPTFYEELKSVVQLLCLAGKSKSVIPIFLSVRKERKQIPLCETNAEIRIHDLRESAPIKGGQWSEWGTVIRDRWNYAPTIDELRKMIDDDIAKRVRWNGAE